MSIMAWSIVTHFPVGHLRVWEARRITAPLSMYQRPIVAQENHSSRPSKRRCHPRVSICASGTTFDRKSQIASAPIRSGAQGPDPTKRSPALSAASEYRVVPVVH